MDGELVDTWAICDWHYRPRQRIYKLDDVADSMTGLHTSSNFRLTPVDDRLVVISLNGLFPAELSFFEPINDSYVSLIERPH